MIKKPEKKCKINNCEKGMQFSFHVYLTPRIFIYIICYFFETIHTQTTY